MPYHNYFCNVISIKFPRLLAEREIIANAFLSNDVKMNRICMQNRLQWQIYEIIS